MREIEFRAWDLNNKVMHDKVHYLDSFNEILQKEYWSVMQYTGLKDKNGKEIYEGDIIKWREGLWLDVYGGNGKGKLKEVVEFIEYGFYPFTENQGYSGVVMFTHDTCEVIGNIYSNPELL